MTRQTKRLVLLALTVSPVVLAVSTSMAVVGLASQPAVYIEMTEVAQDWRDYVEQQQADPAAAQPVADTLAPVEESICRSADLELNSGGVTGSGGEGTVSAALESTCAALGKISETLEATALRSAQRTEKLDELLKTLRETPERQELSIFERRKKFEAIEDEIRAVLAEGGSENLRDKVSAQTALLSDSLIELDNQGGQFGERQSSAVGALKKQLGSVNMTVGKFLAQSVAGGEVQEPREILWSGAAILRHWTRLLPQLVLAVAIDLSPLWLGYFLLVSRQRLAETKAALRRKARNRTTRPNTKSRNQI